jgi:hypothetical protein
MLILANGPAAPHPHHATPSQADGTARLLGGIALVIAALGAAIALIRRRP